MMARALVSLGSNLGERAALLEAGLANLVAVPEVRLVARSRWHETSPVGGPVGQSPFLNGAATIETSLTPPELLDRLHEIELKHGRVREIAWGPRTLDLDLLLYDDVVMCTERLTLPHPRAAFRKFVLQPAAEIAPDWRHPVLGRTPAELWRHLQTAVNYAAFVGLSGGFRSQFAGEAADAAQARLVDPTPREVPAFDELVGSGGLESASVIEFLQARATAIRVSLAEAGGAWVIDDAWLDWEATQLIRGCREADRAAVVAAWNSLRSGVPGPKVLVSLRKRMSSAIEETASLRKTLPGEIALPPIVDINIADREAALSEISAACEAAK